jgi:hypothetical protein
MRERLYAIQIAPINGLEVIGGAKFFCGRLVTERGLVSRAPCNRFQ